MKLADGSTKIKNTRLLNKHLESLEIGLLCATVNRLLLQKPRETL